REQQVRRAKNELERLEVDKPNRWDMLAAQGGQISRMVGNFFKGLSFGQTPGEAAKAIRENYHNLERIKLNYRDQLTEIDQRKRELQQEISNLQNLNSVDQALEQISWHKDISKKGYHDLRDNLDKERRTTYHGLGTPKGAF